MDWARISEIVIVALLQLVGIVVYVVVTRERLNFVKEGQHELKLAQERLEKIHFDHAQSDSVKFGELNTQLAVIIQGSKHIESDIGMIRQSFHEVRNAMQVVLGQAAVLGLSRSNPDPIKD